MPLNAGATSTSADMEAAVEMVTIPDDLFSEESGFHGSAETQRFYEELAATYDPQKYWAIHEWNAQVIAVKGKKAQLEAAKRRAEREAEKRARDGLGRAQQQAEDGDQDLNLKDEESHGGDFPANSREVKMELDAAPMAIDQGAPNTDEENDQDRDKSRPEPQNHYEGIKMAKQLAEPLSEFLARLPPSRTTLSAGGPWIWIANPYPPPARQRNVPETGDIATFKQLGFRLLEDYRSRREEVEARNPGKPAASVTRMLRSERLRLEPGIRQLAQENGVTCGKWMLFPGPDEVDRVWKTVATATWEGQLGIAAKVAVALPEAGQSDGDSDAEGRRENRERQREYERGRTHRLICVCTSDFSDKQDVQRVLLAIRRLGLLDPDDSAARMGGSDDDDEDKASKPAKPKPKSKFTATASLKTIYYKCDAYTYLDIMNGNAFKLKASMYNSRDLLASA